MRISATKYRVSQGFQGYVSIMLSHCFFHFRSLYQCFLHSFVRSNSLSQNTFLSVPYPRRILADIEQNIEFRKDFTRGIRVNYVVSSFLSFSIALSMLLTFFRSQNMFLSKTLLIHAEYWPINRENKIGETSNPEADKEENFSLGKIKFSPTLSSRGFSV